MVTRAAQKITIDCRPLSTADRIQYRTENPFPTGKVLNLSMQAFDIVRNAVIWFATQLTLLCKVEKNTELQQQSREAELLFEHQALKFLQSICDP
jgi:hypothetical protein